VSRLLTFALCVAVVLGAFTAHTADAGRLRHLDVQPLDYAVNRIAV